MLIDLSCPVENQGTFVKTNSETNEPYLLLKLFNLSDKTISELSFRVLVYDANGAELGTVPVELTSLEAGAKSYFAENKAVSLVGLEEAKHFVVQIDKAIFEDGSAYELSEENIVDVDETIASVDDALLLRTFVKDAICFSAEHDTYWRCVCGRANLPSIEACLRCGNGKDEMLQKFSSNDALLQTLSKAEEEEALKISEENARLEAEKIEKSKKIKKNLLIVLIAVVIAAVVAVASFFIYKAVLNSMAKNAAENGDYQKAYSLYQKTGSDKIGDIAAHVQGNTPANLLFQSGLMSEDEDNLYYLAYDNKTYSFQLFCENKATKETTMLTDAAGGSLNVTKDWIYFVDTDYGYIKRVAKDGATTETIVETGTSYLSVIGNTIYYICTDYNNPNNLPIEQCEILAAQNQMETYMHLYKMDVDKREPVLVSEENMNTCYIYGGRIYYLTETKDEWTNSNLYSMTLDGKDKQAVVETPVSSFYVEGHTLYYIEMYNPEMKGQTVDANGLSYTLIQKDLVSGEEKTLVPELMPTYLNANNDKLFFIALDRASFIQSLNGSTETAPSMALYAMDKSSQDVTPLVTGEVSIFNVIGEDIIMYIGSQGMCRVKADGTGFAEVIAHSDSATEEIPVEELPVEGLTDAETDENTQSE